VGLTSSALGAAGHFDLVNLSDTTRHLTATVINDKGQQEATHLTLRAGATTMVSPPSSFSGTAVALDVLADGAGLAGTTVMDHPAGLQPCTTTGITQWFASGIDTTVGHNTFLHLFNPSATPAVINVAVFKSNGFSTPTAYRGVTIQGHQLRSFDLNAVIPNNGSFGLRARALRGVIVPTISEATAQFATAITGSTGTARSFSYPAVTTENGAGATLTFVNPTGAAVKVTANISLASYTLPRQKATIAPYSFGTLTITPNSAIPVAGLARVTVTTSRAVASSLVVTGEGSSVASPVVDTHDAVVKDEYGAGFTLVRLTNSLSHNVTVTVTDGLTFKHLSYTVAGHSFTDIIPHDAAVTYPAGQGEHAFFRVHSVSGVGVTVVYPGHFHGQRVTAPF
jgi:hypothetical protein